MNSKSFIAVLMTAFLLVSSLSLICAANNFTVSPTAVVLTKAVKSANFTVTDTLDARNIAVNSGTATATISDSSGNNVLVTITPVAIADSASQTAVTVSYTSLPVGFETGVFSKSIAVTDGVAADAENVVINLVSGVCTSGSINDTNLEFDVDISNNGEGEESDWLPLDNVEIDVDFENNKEEDIEDILIEFALIDKNTGKNIADDLDWISKDDEEADVGDVDEGDNAKHTFEFTVPNDIDTGTYLIMVKVYPEGSEAATCIDHATSGLSETYYQEIDISRESDDERQVVLEDIRVEPSTSQCAQEVVVTARAYNIGTSDQDAVKVKIYNKALGVDLYQVIENFDMDESASIEFTFKVSADAAEQLHTFNLFTEYDYDEEDDEDDGEVNFDSASFSETSETSKTYLTVKGECVGSLVGAEVDSAKMLELNADVKAVAGEKAVYIIPIKNTGDIDTTFKLSVSGVSGWAAAKLSSESITIKAGETANAELTLDIDRDAEPGEKEFTLKTAYGEDSKEQTILVEIVEAGMFSGGFAQSVKDNWFVYTIVIVDIILILAIIIAIRSVVSKKQ